MESRNNWQKTMYDSYFANSTLNSSALRDKAKSEVDLIISLLQPAKSSTILDAPCGTGRHAYLFAKKGFNVTGLDISKDCLKIANNECCHKNIQYAHGDMKNLKAWKGQFDITLNLFTSFGYFQTDRENASVLKQLYSTLRPGGWFVLNLINRDWLLEVYQGNDCKYILNKRAYNSKTKYNEAWMTVIDKQTKKEKTYYHRCRLYDKSEVLGLLKSVGFKNIKVVGDSKGNRFKKRESTHPFFFAQK